MVLHAPRPDGAVPATQGGTFQVVDSRTATTQIKIRFDQLGAMERCGELRTVYLGRAPLLAQPWLSSSELGSAVSENHENEHHCLPVAHVERDE